MIIGGRAHTIEEVELIGKAGLAFAEASLIDPKEFHKSVSALKKIRDSYGLILLGHGPEEGNPFQPEVLRKTFLSTIKSLLDCAREVSISLFTVHFWLDARFIDPPVIKQKLDILSEMAVYASERGIRLCIENLSERVYDFSPAFDSIETLDMTLDIGHGELLTEKNTSYDFSNQYLERINHIHLHDNRGGNSPKDDLHLPLGEGIIDFFSILQYLKQKGFDKTMTLEVKSEHLVRGKEIVEGIWNGVSQHQKG